MKLAKDSSPSFALHTGDYVDFSIPEEWKRVQAVLDRLPCPTLGTPGNHAHVKKGFAHYLATTGQERNAYLRFGPVLVVSLDTSRSRVGSQDLAWLEEVVNAHPECPLRFLLTHVPPWDPRPGEDHCLGKKDGGELTRLVGRLRFTAAFCAHVHCHALRHFDGVPWHISAGAGAPLYRLPDQGGFYHALRVHVDGTKARIEIVPLPPSPTAAEILLRYRSTWARYYERWVEGKGRQAEVYRHAFYRYARAIREMEAHLVESARSKDTLRIRLAEIEALAPKERLHLEHFRRVLEAADHEAAP